jgi:hypothetical protein
MPGQQWPGFSSYQPGRHGWRWVTSSELPFGALKPSVAGAEWHNFLLAIQQAGAKIHVPGPRGKKNKARSDRTFTPTLCEGAPMAGDLRGFTSLSMSEAVFCADCEMISNSTSVCRCCGSSALLNISQLLGGSLRNVQRAVLLVWPETPHRRPMAEWADTDSSGLAA